MFICDSCGCKFRNKQTLSSHILIHEDHTDNINKHSCSVCKLCFSTKKLLNNHVRQCHSVKIKGKIIKETSKLRYRCEACNRRFLYGYQLKSHIRSTHFNLVTNAPYCNFKEINEVWFERVMNTNIIVEIKKIDHNNLLIRKLDDNTAVKPTEMAPEVIDVRMLYPTMNKINCSICKKGFERKKLQKHIIDEHNVLLTMKCDKCNIVFKRFTPCFTHVCPTEGVVS